MSKRFVTIFPHLKPEHLGKDVAQIPFLLQEQEGSNTELVTLDHGEDLSFASERTPGLRITVLPREGTRGGLEKALIKYLRREGKQIDQLHLFHFHKTSFAYGSLYKMVNPKGFLYLKADIYNPQLEEREAIQSRKKWKRPPLRWLENRFLRSLDLISLENTEALRIFKKMYPKHAEKCIYLPSGMDDRFLQEKFPVPTSWEEKKNRFLVVGRIGLTVKNHHILLQAIKDLNVQDWEFRFIGPIYEEFKPFMEDFLSKNPQVEEKVEFLGPIFDRCQLFKEYDQAKVQLITSTHESFGHVLVEGGAFDQYMVGTTGIYSFDDITMNGRFGTAIEPKDPQKLADLLQDIIEREEEYRIQQGEFREHIMERFGWTPIISTLKQALDHS